MLVSQKGGEAMNAYVTKPNTPFITKHELKRTPITDENKKMAQFIDSHTFSFSIHKETDQVEVRVTPKS